MIERRRRRHRCFGGGKSKVASVAAVLKSMRLGRSIVTLERFLAEIKTRRECERGRENGPWHGLEGPWVRFVMPSKCRDERPSPLQVRPYPRTRPSWHAATAKQMRKLLALPTRTTFKLQRVWHRSTRRRRPHPAVTVAARSECCLISPPSPYSDPPSLSGRNLPRVIPVYS